MGATGVFERHLDSLNTTMLASFQKKWTNHVSEKSCRIENRLLVTDGDQKLHTKSCPSKLGTVIVEDLSMIACF